MSRRFYPTYSTEDDYKTNALSYYDFLAKLIQQIKVFTKRIDEYDDILAQKLQEINDRLDYYMEEWDKNLEEFPENVQLLLEQWMQDGTLEHLINVELLGSRSRIVVSMDEPEHNNTTYWYEELSYPHITNNIVVSKSEPAPNKIWYELEDKENG